MKKKRHRRKIINHHIAKGTRESNPRVHDLQHQGLGKAHLELQIMDTRMGFPCPFRNVVIDSINPIRVAMICKSMTRLAICGYSIFSSHAFVFNK